MNKKVMWLMVGLVAAVLPAVAVADVMVTAYVHGNETSVPDAFYVQEGSNYANAHNLAGFTWTTQSTSESEFLGTITLGYMGNETITEVNVLDVNFTGLTGTAYFNLSVTVPQPSGTSSSVGTGDFPTGSYIYISNNTPLSLTSPTNGISLSVSGTTTLHFMVHEGSTIYIGFAVGSGAGGGSFELGMELVEL